MISVAERVEVIAVVRGTDRKIVCPECDRRFLADVRLYTALPPGLVWARLKCQSCGAWRWYDLATGVSAATPTDLTISA